MASRVMSPPSDGESRVDVKMEEDHSKSALTPPTSEGTKGFPDDSGSDLSDLEPEEHAKAHSGSMKIEGDEVRPELPEVNDDTEIMPDHYYDGGKIPVFKPTMNQFRSFKDFVSKIDKYGMKSGIVKVIPPKEWRDNLPALDEQVKTIRVKNPITQEFHGTHGTYTQANMEKQRSYNLPQWKALCDESNHQPPAKRGERRRNQEKTVRAPSSRGRASALTTTTPSKSAPIKNGRGRRKTHNTSAEESKANDDNDNADDVFVDLPLTPTSPALEPSAKKVKMTAKKGKGKKEVDLKPKGRQPKSVGARRLYNRRDQVDVVDEAAFDNFDYRIYNQDEFTPERVHELETAYWRSLNFNNPLYGADMPGSLFDDSTKEWNVAKLENLLDVLGQKVPGVNTAYLYLGMWKASFAWHLEDVDLYSINYIHFGAPKQWYSISQEDARRFEAAMKSIWSTDAKNCDQFLRHKTYLISPQLLQSQFNIKVNRLVHNEGEFVITYPYGYHSGYNLGYNCAESVNFATDSWLDYGKVARKCNCEADSVWVDVREIERKLRGEPTPEYYEETDDDDDDEEAEDDTSHLPTPPGSVKGKTKRVARRRKDKTDGSSKKKIKKIKIKIRIPTHEPCILCPNDSKYEELLPTDDGRRAHRRCGMYTPETHILEDAEGTPMVCDIAMIDKARLELKCNYCRNRKGSVFQCSSKKCTRAYHATCAMPAGVQIDIGPTSVWGDDGTEYIDTGFDFRCRIHRSKKGKNADSQTLETNELVHKKASKLVVGDAVQAQFVHGDIFAGNIEKIFKSEQTVLLSILPRGDKVEVEWKYLLFFDPTNSQLPMPSENAVPLPTDLLRKSRTTAEDPAVKVDGIKPGDPFCDADGLYKWAEFASCRPIINKLQKKSDMTQADRLWHFLYEHSTDRKAFYTHDPAIRDPSIICNTQLVEQARSNDAEAKAAKQAKLAKLAKVNAPVNPPVVNQNALNAARVTSLSTNYPNYPYKERPYHGKYAITDPIPSYKAKSPHALSLDTQILQNPPSYQQRFAAEAAAAAYRPNLFPYDSTASTSGSTGSYKPLAPPHYQNPTANDFDVRGLLQKVDMNRDLPYSLTQAPTANMMGIRPNGRLPSLPSISHFEADLRHTTAPEAGCTMSRQSSLLGETNTSTDHEAKGESCLPLDAKYYYLHEAERRRPRVYQSPYAVGGGFSDSCSLAPAAPQKSRPRGPSMSEQFLTKQSPSDKEKVSHEMNEAKAKALERQNSMKQRRQSTSQPLSDQTSTHQGHQYAQSQPAMTVQMSVLHNHSDRPPGRPGHGVTSYFEQAAAPAKGSSPVHSHYPNASYSAPQSFSTSSIYPSPTPYNRSHAHYIPSKEQHPNPQPQMNTLRAANLPYPQNVQALTRQQQQQGNSPSDHVSFNRKPSNPIARTDTNSSLDRNLWYAATPLSGPSQSPTGARNSNEVQTQHNSDDSPLRRVYGNGGEMLPMMP